MKFSLYTLLFLGVFATMPITAQIITNVDPNSSLQCQKLTITVTGESTSFIQGTSSVNLTYQNYTINPTVNTVISSTQIEGIFYFNPDQPIGSYDVNVNSGAWGDVTLQDGFLLNPPALFPQLVSQSPDTAYIGSAVEIEIVGENTHFGIDGVYSSTWFTSSEGGYLTASSVIPISPLNIVANLAVNASSPTGLYDLHVSNYLDGELVLENVLLVMDEELNPEIVLVEPNSAHQGEGLSVTVTGSETDFQQGTSVLSLQNTYHTIYPDNHTVVNDTVITGYFEFSNDNTIGYYDVTVSSWLLDDLVLENGFELLASGNNPELLSCTPSSANQGTSVSLEIKARNTLFDKEGNAASVTLRQGYVELYGKNVTVIDSVTLRADYVFSYANDFGLYDLIVHTTFDGTLTLNNTFTLIETEPNASIVSVIPDSAYSQEVLTISVTGKNIVFMQGTSNLNLSQGGVVISTPSEVVVNDTVIAGEFNFLNTYPLGKYDVNVDNGYAWPSLTLTDGFSLKLFDFIHETGSIALLTVYPNPTNGLLNIKRNFNVSGSFSLLIYDAKGNLLLEDLIKDVANEKQINLTTYGKGVYLLKVIQNQKEQTERFIIQ